MVALIAVVLIGESSRHDPEGPGTVAAAASSSSPTTQPASTTSTVALDALARQYLDAVGPSNAAELAYNQACGCPNHPDMKAAIAALPALLAAQQEKNAKLSVLAARAPPPIAADLQAMITAKQPYLDDMARIIALAPTSDLQGMADAIAAFRVDGGLGRRESAQVRRDLGLPPV